MTRRTALALAGGLLALGVGAAGASTQVGDDPAPQVVRPDRPVSRSARDLGDIRAHNSPALARSARDPQRLAVANRIDTPRFGCALHVSSDGGRRWLPVRIPIPAGEQRKCFAPDVAFDAAGRLHVSYVTLRGVGNVPHAVWLATARPDGRALAAPRKVGGPLAFQVRLAADPSRPDRLLLSWVQARDVGLLKFTGPGNPIVSRISSDGGRTWSRARPVNPARRERAIAPTPMVGADGALYVLYLDLGDDRLDYEGAHEALGGPPYAGRFTLVLARSRDGGATWAESVVDDRVVPVSRFIAFLPPFPSLAQHARSGRLHVSFHDARAGSPDVYAWTLERGAANWGGPVRVNDTPRRDGTAQYLPRLAVAEDGRVDVAYYDRRSDPRDARAEVSLQSSWDGGRSWSPRVRLSGRGFDSRIGWLSERELPQIGSRIGLVSEEGSALAVWTDTRAGTDASNKQDLWTVRVSFPAASAAADAARAVLRWGGLLLVLAGLLAAARALRNAPA